MEIKVIASVKDVKTNKIRQINLDDVYSLDVMTDLETQKTVYEISRRVYDDDTQAFPSIRIAKDDYKQLYKYAKSHDRIKYSQVHKHDYKMDVDPTDFDMQQITVLKRPK